MASVQYRLSGRSAKAIAESVEAAVRAGTLAAGAELPSVRSLAGELGVAPGTAAAAYRLLRERGVVETRGRSGTLVRARPPVAARSSVAPLPPGVRDLASGQPSPRLLPTLLPARTALGRVAAAPDAAVLPELLELGRRRLGADAVPVEHLTVAGGGLDGISRVLAAHLRPGDVLGVEDPGWPNLLDLAGALGLRLQPLPVDAQGPTVGGLRQALARNVRAVVITSRAQNPTGAYVSAARAGALRAVLARHPDLLVVEDDHAGELARAPLATVAGSTRCWAFVRSASKPYGPDLRVSVVAGDEVTVSRVQGRMRVGSGWVSGLLQHVTLAMMTSVRVAGAVTRAGAAYDEQRAALLTALEQRGVAAQGATGLNVWVPVPDETAAVSGLLASGWAVAAGARFRQATGPGLRITVGDLDPRRDIGPLADAVAGLVRGTTDRFTT